MLDKKQTLCGNPRQQHFMMIFHKLVLTKTLTRQSDVVKCFNYIITYKPLDI